MNNNNNFKQLNCDLLNDLVQNEWRENERGKNLNYCEY